MKVVLALAVVWLLFAIGGSSEADAQGCDGQVVTRKGPNGKTLTLCLDGKYSTCLRDGQRLGHSYAAAKRYCDGLPNLRK